MKELLDFLKENEKAFKHYISYYKEKLEEMDKKGLVYITSGGDSNNAQQHRAELKKLLLLANFRNVLTIDDVSRLNNNVHSDVTYANTLLCDLCRYSGGLVIHFDYSYFEE